MIGVAVGLSLERAPCALPVRGTGGGPAAEAGLQAGDVLVAWNGLPVSARFEEELPAVRKRIADTPVGARVTMTLLRDGEELKLHVKTKLRPDIESDEAEYPLWGLTTRDITPEIARRQRLQTTDGALITGVRGAGPASVADLRSGDVIREVEGVEITNTAGLLERYRKLREAGGKRMLVKMDRGSKLRLTVLEPESE